MQQRINNGDALRNEPRNEAQKKPHEWRSGDGNSIGGEFTVQESRVTQQKHRTTSPSKAKEGGTCRRQGVITSSWTISRAKPRRLPHRTTRPLQSKAGRDLLSAGGEKHPRERTNCNLGPPCSPSMVAGSGLLYPHRKRAAGPKEQT